MANGGLMKIEDMSRLPQSGQFVITWEYNTKIWSAVLKWYDGELRAYERETDKFLKWSQPETDWVDFTNN